MLSHGFGFLASERESQVELQAAIPGLAQPSLWQQLGKDRADKRSFHSPGHLQPLLPFQLSHSLLFPPIMTPWCFFPFVSLALTLILP